MHLGSEQCIQYPEFRFTSLDLGPCDTNVHTCQPEPFPGYSLFKYVILMILVPIAVG